MKHAMILGFLVSLTAITSCAREIDRPVKVNAANGELTFSAINADDMQTRTVRKDDGSVWWSPQESIHVFYGELSSKFTSNNTSASATATFVGSLEGFELDSQKQFWALYPYWDADSFDGEYLYFTLPAAQKAVAGTFDRDLFPAIARSSGTELSFRNVCGGVKFRVAKPDVTKVTFQGNQSEPIAGTVQVELDKDGIPAVKAYSQPESEITLSAPAGETLKTGEWYHLVSCPVALAQGYTITLHYKDGHQEKVTSEKSVVINGFDSTRNSWSGTY